MERQNNKSREFLALTALEEFWDMSQPILFLGEWCQKYERKNIWDGLNAIVLQSKKLCNVNSFENYQYAMNVYEKLLPKLGCWLNEFHGTNHSLKYWKLLIGPFLFWYTQVVYDRFLYLKAAYDEYADLETWGLSNRTFLTPANTNEFVCFAWTHDKWNLQLFTQIIDLAFKKPLLYKEINWEVELQARKIQYQSVLYKKRTHFLLFLLKLINKIKPSDIGVLTGFSTRECFKLMLQSRCSILPILPMTSFNRGQNLGRAILTENNVDMQKRKGILNIVANDELSKLVINTLPVNLPFNFIEGYKEEVKISKKYFPYSCKLIFQEQVASYDQYKFWMGEQIEKGAKLVSNQHGGCYGMQKASSAEFLERHVSDYFVSWGWNSSSGDVEPGFIPYAEKLFAKYFRKEENKECKEIVWIATLCDWRYQISIHDWAITSKPYLDYQKKFLSSLTEKNTSAICLRLDPGTHNVEQIRECHPNLNIYLPDGRNSFYEQINKAKIIVLDNPSTAFLYVLAFNIPTILFWDKEHWIFRDEAKPYLDMLQHAGIYYDSPEAAAEILNKIADDPCSWWSSEIVQRARQQFCDNFARVSPDYLQEWSDILLNLNKSKKIDAESIYNGRKYV